MSLKTFLLYVCGEQVTQSGDDIYKIRVHTVILAGNEVCAYMRDVFVADGERRKLIANDKCCLMLF